MSEKKLGIIIYSYKLYQNGFTQNTIDKEDNDTYDAIETLPNPCPLCFFVVDAWTDFLTAANSVKNDIDGSHLNAVETLDTDKMHAMDGLTDIENKTKTYEMYYPPHSPWSSSSSSQSIFSSFSSFSPSVVEERSQQLPKCHDISDISYPWCRKHSVDCSSMGCYYQDPALTHIPISEPPRRYALSYAVFS